jgi:hypothetical protein
MSTKAIARADQHVESGVHRAVAVARGAVARH